MWPFFQLNVKSPPVGGLLIHIALHQQFLHILVVAVSLHALAVGIATDRLREEFGAAVYKAQARVVLDRIRYCYSGNRAADARRHLQQARKRSRAV